MLHYFYEEEFLDKNKDPSKYLKKQLKLRLKITTYLSLIL